MPTTTGTFPEWVRTFLALVQGFWVSMAVLVVAGTLWGVRGPRTVLVALLASYVACGLTLRVLMPVADNSQVGARRRTDMATPSLQHDALDPPYWFREGLCWALAFAATINAVTALTTHVSRPTVSVLAGILLGVVVYAACRRAVVTRPAQQAT